MISSLLELRHSSYFCVLITRLLNNIGTKLFPVGVSLEFLFQCVLEFSRPSQLPCHSGFLLALTTSLLTQYGHKPILAGCWLNELRFQCVSEFTCPPLVPRHSGFSWKSASAPITLEPLDAQVVGGVMVDQAVSVRVRLVALIAFIRTPLLMDLADVFEQVAGEKRESHDFCIQEKTEKKYI